MAGMSGKVSTAKYLGTTEGNKVGHRTIANEARRVALRSFTKGIRQESRAVARAIRLGDVDAADEVEG